MKKSCVGPHPQEASFCLHDKNQHNTCLFVWGLSVPGELWWSPKPVCSGTRFVPPPWRSKSVVRRKCRKRLHLSAPQVYGHGLTLRKEDCGRQLSLTSLWPTKGQQPIPPKPTLKQRELRVYLWGTLLFLFYTQSLTLSPPVNCNLNAVQDFSCKWLLSECIDSCVSWSVSSNRTFWHKKQQGPRGQMCVYYKWHQLQVYQILAAT